MSNAISMTFRIQSSFDLVFLELEFANKGSKIEKLNFSKQNLKENTDFLVDIVREIFGIGKIPIYIRADNNEKMTIDRWRGNK